MPPASTTGLLEVFRRRYLLRLLVKREISARYSGSFLGLFWSYIQPAVKLAMYYFLFQVLIGRGSNIDNYAIHVFAGLVMVHYFTETAGYDGFLEKDPVYPYLDAKGRSIFKDWFPMRACDGTRCRSCASSTPSGSACPIRRDASSRRRSSGSDAASRRQ